MNAKQEINQIFRLPIISNPSINVASLCLDTYAHKTKVDYLFACRLHLPVNQSILIPAVFTYGVVYEKEPYHFKDRILIPIRIKTDPGFKHAAHIYSLSNDVRLLEHVIAKDSEAQFYAGIGRTALEIILTNSRPPGSSSNAKLDGYYLKYGIQKGAHQDQDRRHGYLPSNTEILPEKAIRVPRATAIRALKRAASGLTLINGSLFREIERPALRYLSNYAKKTAIQGGMDAESEGHIRVDMRLRGQSHSGFLFDSLDVDAYLDHLKRKGHQPRTPDFELDVMDKTLLAPPPSYPNKIKQGVSKWLGDFFNH